MTLVLWQPPEYYYYSAWSAHLVAIIAAVVTNAHLTPTAAFHHRSVVGCKPCPQTISFPPLPLLLRRPLLLLLFACLFYLRISQECQMEHLRNLSINPNVSRSEIIPQLSSHTTYGLPAPTQGVLFRGTAIKGSGARWWRACQSSVYKQG